MDSHEGRYMRRVKELLDEYEATQPRRSNQNLQAEPTTTQNLPPNRTAPPHNEQHPTTSQNSQPNIIAPPRIFPNVSTSQNMALQQTLAQRIENVTSKKFSPYSISKAQFRARPKTPSRRSVSVEFKIPKVILLPVKSHFLSLNKKQNSFIASHKLFRDNLMLLRTDSESEVKQKLRQRFEPLLNNKDFIIVKSEGDVLVEPILDVQQCLDGNNVAEIFLRQQKKMYVIPSVDLDPRYTGSDCPFLTHLCQRKVDEFMERDEQEEESENDQSAFEFMEILDPKDQSEDDQVTPKYLEKHDQREDHGDHSYAAAIQESLEISKEGIMQTLKNQLVKEDQSKLIVDRGHPFESAIIWFQLPGFDHRKNIYVQFTNTFGGKQEGVKPLTEGGIDLGGPTLEFFQLSIDDACHSSLFEGPEEARFLTLDADAVCENKFYHCGLLFALSITHGGPGPNCFAPEFVSCLEKQSLSDRLLSENAVFDVDLRSQIETLKNINAIDSLRDFVVNNGIVGLAGINTVINSLDEKDRVTEACLKFILIHRLEAAFNQFVKGLQTFNFLSTMSRNMPLLREYFEPCQTMLTAEVVLATFFIVRSKDTSAEFEIENRVLMYFQNYLRILEGELVKQIPLNYSFFHLTEINEKLLHLLPESNRQLYEVITYDRLLLLMHLPHYLLLIDSGFGELQVFT